MKRSFIALTTILAASSYVLSAQVPLYPKPMGDNDPSFPQHGTIKGIQGTNGPVSQGVTLAEALTIDRKAGVWWDYARDVTSVVSRAVGLVENSD